MELWTSCYGIFFTWDNNRGGKDFIAEKLDMVMFNQWWLSAFPQCLVEYLIPIISYHSPGGKDFIAKRLDMVMFDQGRNYACTRGGNGPPPPPWPNEEKGNI